MKVYLVQDDDYEPSNHVIAAGVEAAIAETLRLFRAERWWNHYHWEMGSQGDMRFSLAGTHKEFKDDYGMPWTTERWFVISEWEVAE